MTQGYVHSIENGAMRDGPGVRFVIFFAGCPLRCQYCHNPDTWKLHDGKLMEASEIIQQLQNCAQFLRVAGGVTISGGEPFMQPEFLTEILVGAKQLGLHTAVDTSGFLYKNLSQTLLDNIDLYLLDIKSFDPQVYHTVTEGDLAPTLEMAQKLAELHKPVWLRYVLVPNLTDQLNDIANLAKFLQPMSNIEYVEVLPFHQLGKFKWDELGYDYRLADTQSPTNALMEQVKQLFRQQGLTVLGDPPKTI